MGDKPVVIVGAGLAGLACGVRLAEEGREVRLLEASDSVGGRVRTDEVEGFLLDRGFQVYLTSYPEGRRQLDLEALDLYPFDSGALVWRHGAFHPAYDPLRHPGRALGTLLAPLGGVGDKLRMARLKGTLQGLSDKQILDRPEVTTRRVLRERYGFGESIREGFFRPFLGGIFLEPELTSSSRMFETVFRFFSQGRATLPAAGMGAIPRQLSRRLPPGVLRVGCAVRAVEPGAVILDDASRMEAGCVVVATEAPACHQLLGLDELPPGRGVTCLYYAAPDPPLEEPVLVLDGEAPDAEGSGPINNLAVLSNVAPSYAPPGRALISVTVLDPEGARPEGLEEAVRRQVRAWFGPRVTAWELLRTYRIPYALPDQAPPFLSPPERPVRHAPGVYVCGDHRATASINGALLSGRHAAEAVLEDTGAGDDAP